MELLLALAVLVLFDLAVLRWGVDSAGRTAAQRFGSLE